MEWVESTIGKVCDVGGGVVKTGPFGSQLHQSDYEEDGIPVVMPKDIIDGYVDETTIARVSEDHVNRLSKHKLSEGDIVYGRRGDIGRQALVRKENIGWLCGTGCLRVTLGSAPIDCEFLHLYLRQPDVIKWISNHAIGATMPNLNTSILRGIPILFPKDKNYQKELAGIVTTYDNLIQNNNRRIAILEETAQSLYREWFVNFRFPGYVNTKFVDTQFGKTPKGWEVKPAKEIFDINIGKTPPRKQAQWFSNVGAGVKWVSIKDMGKCQTFILHSNESLTNEAVDKFNIKIIPSNTVILSFKLTVGKIAITSEEMATNEAIAHFNINDPEVMCKEYIYNYLKDFNFQTLGNTSSIGNAINSQIVKRMPILIPPTRVIKQYKKLIQPIFHQIKVISKSNKNLQSQRDLLLPKLISGKVTI